MTESPEKETSPAVAVRPDLDWNRRSIRVGNLQRVLAVMCTGVACCFGMGWYSMQGRAAGQPAPNAPRAIHGNYVLPALAPARPVAAERAEQPVVEDLGTTPEEAPASTQAGGPPPQRRRHEEPTSASPVQIQGISAPAVPASSVVIWRPAPELAHAAESAGIVRDPQSPAAGFRPVSAVRLPSSDYLLGKGTVVRCSLETAIDSELAGLATCVTGADVYGSNGRQILLARGTKLIGEVHNDLRAGRSRVLVIWVEARTPDGLLVPIASPATDELGRAGLPGEVDTHFMDRFGAALLISAVDAGMQGIANRHGGGALVISTQGSDAVLTEVLRNTVAIPPTVRVAAGTSLTVVVAQDVDFGGVISYTAAP